MASVLIVDDERAIRLLLAELLNRDNHRVEMVSDGSFAVEKLREREFDLVISDLHMQQMDGIGVLRATKEKSSNTEVLILTGNGTIPTAVEAMRLGAYDYITKPLDIENFRLKVRKALERRAMRLEIENQRREIQTQQEMIQRDLKLAEQVQRSLVPSSFSNDLIDVDIRYLPMIGVGGDFCDLFLDDENRLYLTVVDVTGHGITAALLVNRVSTELRRLVRERLQPKAILCQLNDFIIESFAGTGMFLTMFSGLLDLKKGSLTHAASAHPAAMLWRKAESEIVCLESQNAIIGYMQMPESKFEQTTSIIRPGDKVVVYTDGIIETENRAGESLGLQGLIDYFKPMADQSPSLASQQIIDNLFKFGHGPLRDDVYLVIAGMKG
jgi:sigma-B regulation protein RsbU (phosphoserine phosphatase)